MNFALSFFTAAQIDIIKYEMGRKIEFRTED